MRICVLTEPYFRGGSWCVRVLAGLNDALRAKKIDAEYPERPDDLPCFDGGAAFVLLIGSNPGWIDAALCKAAERGVRPVLLCAQPAAHPPCACSFVGAGLREATDYLLGILQKDGRQAVALYGCNAASSSDLARREYFLTSGVLRTAKEDVFYNEGSLAGCFSRFASRVNDYDGVICANSYAALHLLRSFKAHGIGKNIRVTAFGDTLLAKRFNKELITVSAPYEEYGKAALSVCELLTKNPALDAVNVTVKWALSDKDGAMAGENAVRSAPIDAPADEQFYSDAEMREMLTFENMLEACGETELAVLEAAMAGASVTTIAEKCFLSESTVKYHLKKMRTMCGCGTKEEMIRKLKAYTA